MNEGQRGVGKGGIPLLTLIIISLSPSPAVFFCPKFALLLFYFYFCKACPVTRNGNGLSLYQKTGPPSTSPFPSNLRLDPQPQNSNPSAQALTSYTK